LSNADKPRETPISSAFLQFVRGAQIRVHQLRPLAAAVALGPRTHVELQHDVEMVGRWLR
jgi:hypothetical protein